MITITFPPQPVPIPRVIGRVCLGLLALVAAGTVSAEVYVCTGTSVRVFPDVPQSPDPIRVIEGAATGITECYGMALDSDRNELWVASGDVLVFAADANGNALPLRRIATGASPGGFAVSVAVDTLADEVVVGGITAIATYARSAVGPAAPKRLITDAGISGSIAGVVVDRVRDVLWVTDASSVRTYSRLANGASAPLSLPSAVGGATNLQFRVGQLALHERAGVLFVAAASQPGVLVFDLTGTLVGVKATSSPVSLPFGLNLTGNGRLRVGASYAATMGQPVPIVEFDALPPNDTPGAILLTAAAPAGRPLYGIVSSSAMGCAAGNMYWNCVFRDAFEE